MNEISLLKDSDEIDLDKKAQMYINIFGEEPRNEGYQCKNCEKLYALSDVKSKEIIKCLMCDGEIEGFYSIDEIKSDRESRAKKEGYIGVLAEMINTKELVGFIMGRGTNLDKLNIDKLKLTNEAFDTLKTNISSIFEDFTYDNFFYAADIGVNQAYRTKNKPGLRIASNLYDSREKEIKSKGFEYMLVRTTKKSNVPYKRYKSKGFKEVFDYNDEQDRIILVKPIK